MSQPPYEYAHYMGQHPQQPYQYAAPPIIQPAASFYASPQDPSPAAIAANYASINGSFEMNASRIPGLGLSSSVGTPVQRASYHADNSLSQPQKAFANASSPSAQRAQPPGIIGLQPLNPAYGTGNTPAKPPVIQSNDVSEEGELSEGELEDLYEPRDSNVPAATGTKKPAPHLDAVENLSGSVGDADGSSIYDTGSGRDEIVIDSTSASQPALDDEEDYEPVDYEPEYFPREHSRSYSPHLSPVETRSDAPKSKQSASAHQPMAPFAVPGAATTQSPAAVPSPNGHIASAVAKVDVSADTLKLAEPSPADLPYKSITEAKKKAQEAILGLWPLKVRYQNYVEEGLDPHVVSSLFTELGLDTSSGVPAVTQPTPSTKASSTKPSEVTSTVQPSPKSTPQPAVAVQSSKTGSDKPALGGEPKMADKKSAQEERKDKIARMLAEKKNKTAAPPTAPAPAAAATSNGTASTQSEALKAKLRAEKNQKILEKMAALKKRQEEKSKLSEQPSGTQTPEGEKAIPTTTSEPLSTKDTASAPSFGEQARAPSAPRGPSGLSVPSSPQPTPQFRALKRPVAADFDSYPTSSSGLKRTRTQETLIIDVSDDEDVEMDLGSPTEAPSSAIPNNPGLVRQNSLAAYPPLSNSRTWRGQRSSPATPAAGTPSGHGHKLDFLTQQIEEAKKRIAEAEAKKASKKPSSASTPSRSPVHGAGQADSLRLPKLSDALQHNNNERRVRIASYHLPVVEAALREKQEKLKCLQLEAAQLELELQASLAERERLTAEMDSLDTSVEQEPPHLNGSDEQQQTSIPENIAASQGGSFAVEEPASEPRRPSTDTATQEDPQSTMDREETESLSDNANMDLESEDSDADDVADSTTIVHTEAVTQSDLPQSDMDVPRPDSEDVITTEQVPDTEVQDTVTGDNTQHSVSSRVSLEAQTDDLARAEADTPMQISDADDDDDGGDNYEPLPAPISEASQMKEDTNLENGEVDLHFHLESSSLMTEQVPDEEPYEPNPAQGLQPGAEVEPETSPAEVHFRPSPEPRLLTDQQAQVPSSLSAKQLLSYQSPLRYFHAYRFHPKYLDDVSGGLKSMTYSSKIDASRPLCPSVVDGGQCPYGSGCEFQHFENMVLSDTAIIAELGSTDMYEGEQKGRFIEGLKKVLQDLKAKKVKDFDSITKAIVQYRGEFLGDKSKVLPLKNVAL
ncbi:hypothetical protein JX266_001417 [Neoarthrinium moseri]|nr:hypothetical protein JX266_001417 [Neoarthrinium moseri]